MREMLRSEMLTEIRKQAEEDAEAGIDMPDLSIAVVASGERLSPSMIRDLRSTYETCRMAAIAVAGGAV